MHKFKKRRTKFLNVALSDSKRLLETKQNEITSLNRGLQREKSKAETLEQLNKGLQRKIELTFVKVLGNVTFTAPFPRDKPNRLTFESGQKYSVTIVDETYEIIPPNNKSYKVIIAFANIIGVLSSKEVGVLNLESNTETLITRNYPDKSSFNSSDGNSVDTGTLLDSVKKKGLHIGSRTVQNYLVDLERMRLISLRKFRKNQGYSQQIQLTLLSSI